MINKAMLQMVRRVTPQLIAQDICAVQPMTGPTGQVFTMKVDTIFDRLKTVEDFVCATMTAIEESWMDEFMADQAIMKPMIWCLRELSGMSPEGIYKKPTDNRLVAVQDEYFTMMKWIEQAHPAMIFDFEMRGLKTKRDTIERID